MLDLGHDEPALHPERASAVDLLSEYRQIYIEMRREVCDNSRDIMANPELARYFTRKQ